MLLAIWFLARHYVDKVPGAINDTLSLGLMARYYPYFLLGNYIKHFKLHELAFGSSGVFCFAALVWACSSLLAFKYSEYLISGAAIFVIMNFARKWTKRIVNLKTVWFILVKIHYIYIYFIILHCN